MRTAAYYLFISTLIFSPLAFGTVETWSYTVMETMICASALLLCVSDRKARFYKAPGTLILMFVCGVVLFQAIPLPAGLVQLISPETHRIYLNTAGAISPVQWMPLSIHPKSTMAAFLRFSSYVLFYFIAVQFLSNAALLKRTLSIVAGFGAILAIFVIFEFFVKIMDYPFPYEKILFIRDSVHGAGSVGPYVNRNHYAGLMEMIFPLVLALFLIYRPLVARVGLKKMLADFLLQKQIYSHLLYGSAAVLTGTSLFVTLSRGGIVSLTISMGLLALFLFLNTSQTKAGLFIGIVFVIVMVTTGTDAWDRIFERFDSIRNEAGEISTNRFNYWSDSAAIFRDFPLLGSGAESFEHIYPKYRTFPGNDKLEHAHNDYLEFLVTGGLVVFGLMFAALACILYKTFQTYRKRREVFSVYLFASCLAAVLSILLHAFVEFNMQVGANGLYFFLILALIVSSANTRFRKGPPATYLKLSEVKSPIPILAAFFLLAGVLWFHFGTLLGNYRFTDCRRFDLDAEIPFETRLLVHRAALEASAADPTNPEYFHVLAKISEKNEKKDDALHYYEKTLRLAPLNSQYLQDAGFFLSDLGQKEGADRLIRAGVEYDRHTPSNHFNYAVWLFSEKQTEKGLGILRSAMEMDPATADTYLSLMAWFRMDENQMRRALPDRVHPRLAFADYLASKGNLEKAEASYMEALRFLPNENEKKRDIFMKVYRFFMKTNSYEKALSAIQQAIEHIPGDPRLHRIAGDLYEKLNIPYRAEEEYRKASILDSAVSQQSPSKIHVKRVR